MTAPTYDPDHVSRGVARLIDRYRKPRTSALLASWLEEVQQAEDALWQLLVERWLSSAVGNQLDVLGRIVGEPRRGRDDDTYRVWISARNLVSRSSGRTAELLTIARLLVPAPVTLALEEYYPAAFLMRFGVGLDLDAGYQVAFMLRQAKAAGVLFQMTWPVDADAETFHFAPGDTPVLSSPFGFDEGAFAVVADGSFIPEPVVEPEFPPGTLVIDGVPLVIDGVPLVITPPALALAAPSPALRPIVAAPARIVPRPLAPLALPAPLVGGEFIELEDAFADTTLEMDETGQLFRVALSFQGAVEDLQAGAVEQAADITALQGDVAGQAGDITTLQSNVTTLANGLVDQASDLTDVETKIEAMRFAFSLRTSSVAATDYEEIGVLRFDATPYAGALEFIAELEVSASGQTVQLQLYNLTAAAIVATLSTSLLVTTKVSATVTLPLSEALYSLRLRRVGGDATQRVSCKSAILEVI